MGNFECRLYYSAWYLIIRRVGSLPVIMMMKLLVDLLMMLVDLLMLLVDLLMMRYYWQRFMPYCNHNFLVRLERSLEDSKQLLLLKSWGLMQR